MKEFLAQYGWMLLWALVAAITLAIEAATAEMVSIWFTPGAIAALILSIWVDIFWIQLLVFLALSAVLLAVTRRYFRKHPLTGRAEELNADAIVGQTGVVQEPVDNVRGTGSVKIGPLEWTARSTDDSKIIPEGTIVVVREINGVKVICEAAPNAFLKSVPHAES